MIERIYVSGSGGMLGEAFYHVCAPKYTMRCTDIDVNEDWLEYCDVRDYQAYENDVTQFAPDYLCHLAAYTDLEFCEQHTREAYLTNTIGVENAVLIANKLQIPILYISTAGIFDGQKENYDDWDQPNPLGHYARSKYAGEVFVRENAHRFLICRAGWMMGGGPKKDKKFINKIINQIKAGQNQLYVVNDKLGTPTYTRDFARNTELLMQNGMTGIFNMVCEGQTNRLEVAKQIVAILGLENEIAISDVESGYFQQTYFAPRPPSERLINLRLQLRNLDIMRKWQVALKEYLETQYRDMVKFS